jgi:two-component system, LuxR family, sensor kinase FixL
VVGLWRGGQGSVQWTFRLVRQELQRTRRLVEVSAPTSPPGPGEELLRLAESKAEVLWIRDVAEQGMVYLSPACDRIWGRDGRSLLEASQPWLDAVHPDDRERVRQAASAVPSEGGHDEEYRVICPDGLVRWVHDRALLISDPSGRVSRSVRIAEDVTGRKRAESRSAALCALGRRLSSATLMDEAARIVVRIASDLLGWHSCSLGLVSLDHAGLLPVLTAGTANGEQTECSPAMLEPDSAPIMRETIESGARLISPDGGTVLAASAPSRPADRRMGSVICAPIRDGGQVIGALWVRSDGSNTYGLDDLETLQELADHSGGALARIRSGDALRQNEEQFRAVFQLAPIAMAIHSPDGKYLNTNPAYQRMLDYSHEELRQLGVRRLTYPGDVPDGQRLHRELLAGQRDHYRREKRFARRDGTMVWAESTALAVRDACGRLQYIISMVEDLTERKELTEEILKAREKEQQRLGQDLHDGLCQNLIGVKLRTSLLAMKLEDRSVPEAGEAKAVARSLEQTVQLAYELSRGLQPVLLAREGLACALEELAASTKSSFNITCRFRLRGEVVIQNPDTVAHLYRIAQEAVANAIKHSRGTRITVVLAAGKRNIVLSVADNGMGFSGSRRGVKGLGLDIMQHRARVIGASLQIRPRIGGGSRVVCLLPRGAARVAE